jgi:peptidoglycan/LPS O-acetylase OafA/YrhL
LLAFLGVHTILGLWKSNLEFVSSLLFFRNYASVRVTGFSSIHLWSLAVEEHFYLLWPGLLALSGPRRAKSLAVGLAVSVAVWRMLAHQIAPWPFPDVPLHLRTDLRLDALLWGCVAACVLHGMKQRESLARQVQFSEWILITTVLVTIMRFRTPTATTLVALLVPLMLVGTLLHPEWRISRVLTWGGFTWIGRISYSLYLWQQLFLIPGWQRTSLWQHWPLNLVAALGTATLSYYLLEKPLIRLGRRLSQGYSRNRPGYSAFKNTTAMTQTAS